MKSKIAILMIILTCHELNLYAVYFKLSDYKSGGRVVSLDIKNHFVYTATYDGLIEILDITDPNQPQLSGSIQLADYIPGIRGKIVVSDTLAFILGNSKIHIVNIANPLIPTYAGSLNYGGASDIIISDSKAYIAGYFSLFIEDISDIQSPQLLGSVDGSLDGICIHDTLLFGVHSSSPNNLRIFNISDPYHPELINLNFNLPIYSAAGIDYADFHVFVANSNYVWSIDVTDPVNPVISDTFTIEDQANKIFIKNSKAIVNNSNSGFTVIDISVPSELVELGYFDTPGSCQQVVANDSVVFVANSFSGLQIIDITNPINNQLVGEFQTYSQAVGIGIKDDFVFLADGYVDLDVVDVSDVSDPKLSGIYYNLIGWADNISINKDNMCFSTGYPYHEILFVDITIPNTPVLLNEIYLGGAMMFGSIALFQTDSYLFAGTADTLRIYDITDFSNPVLVSRYATTGEITDVLVANNNAYISVGENGIEIINIEDIKSPQFVGSFDTESYACKLALKSEVLIVADWQSGVQFINVSNPVSPYTVGVIKPHGTSEFVVAPLVIDDKLIIIDTEWNEISTYIVNDMNAIQLQSSNRINAEINKIIFNSDLFFCSVNYHGMSILSSSLILSRRSQDEIFETNNMCIYPNPFTNTASIAFSLNERTCIKIEIFDQRGTKIKNLVNESTDAGKYEVTWDGTDQNNKKVSSGLYTIKFQCGRKNYYKKALAIN